MTDLAKLKVFSTHPHECSYLEGQEATTIFIDPNFEMNREVYSHLSELGFRRSGSHLYRPHCTYCKSCVPARVAVSAFQPTKQQKRTWRRNEDLTVQSSDQIKSDEHYALYESYITHVHFDGDMFPPSRDQYQSFLTAEWDSTVFYEFRFDGKLVGVAVTDQIANGLSAVYTFYDPCLNKRSLGVFAVLWQIEKAKSLNLPYVYLGYWIKDCQKMNYKINYRPIELLINNNWCKF